MKQSNFTMNYIYLIGFVLMGLLQADDQPSSSWSLEKCISMALNNDPQMEILKMEVDILRIKTAGATSKRTLPDLDLNLSSGRFYGRPVTMFSLQNIETIEEPLSVDEGDFLIGTVEMKYSLYHEGTFFGKNKDIDSISLERIKQSNLKIEEYSQAVDYQVTVVYLETLYAQKKMLKQKELLGLYQQKLENAEKINKQGIISDNDLNAIENEYRSAEEKLNVLRQSAEMQQGQLARLIGIAEPVKLKNLQIAPGFEELPKYEIARSLALDRNIQLSIVDSEIKAGLRNLSLQKKKFSPSVYTKAKYAKGSNFEDLSEDLFSVSLNVDFPIFDYFDNKQSILIYQKEIAILRTQREALNRDLENTIYEIYSNIAIINARIQKSESAKSQLEFKITDVESRQALELVGVIDLTNLKIKNKILSIRLIESELERSLRVAIINKLIGNKSQTKAMQVR